MTNSSDNLISGIKIFVVLALSLVTILLSQLVDHYQLVGDELIANNNFEKNIEGWQENGDGLIVPGVKPLHMHIVSEKGQGTVSIRQTLNDIESGKPVRLEGTMKLQDVGRGDKVWEAARIIFVGIDEDGRSIYSQPHILAMRNGTTGWEHYSKVFNPVANTAGYYVEIQLVNVKGSVWVKDLSLRYVKQTLAFRAFLVSNVLLWFVVAFWVLAPYRSSIISSKWNMLIISIGVLALLGSLLPADLKHNIVESVRPFAPWVGEELEVFRIGHFLVYCMLSSVVFWRAKLGRQEINCFGLLVLFAMATEVLQFLVGGRTPRISDFFVDISGMILGLFVSITFSSFRSSKKEPS